MHTTYQEMASRTMPSTGVDRLTNWALGLCGEAEEYRRESDEASQVLELGDVAWHCHAILTALRVDADMVMASPVHADERPSDMLLLACACRVAEIVKKHVYHYKPLKGKELLSNIRIMLWTIEVLARERHNTTLTEVYRLNINKLQERWPEGFAPEKP